MFREGNSLLKKVVLIQMALACAAVFLTATSAPANAAKPPPPAPLVITDVSPDSGATVDSTLVSVVRVDFNQQLSRGTLRNLANVVQVIDLSTGEDVSELDAGGSVGFQGDCVNGQLIHIVVIQAPNTTFECGTTYEVILGGKGKSALKSADRATVSEVPTRVTLEGSTVSWQFRTLPC